MQFLEKASASQWTPMLNLGIGYKIFENIGLELNTNFMVTNLKAEGALLITNEKVNVKARHSNVVITPSFHLPLDAKAKYFLNPKILGYMKRITNALALTAQFDFSDAYGSKEVWESDLGVLNLGVKYALNKK